jgi:hypothetical protein
MQLRAGCKGRRHSGFVYLLSQWAHKGKKNSRLFQNTKGGPGGAFGSNGQKLLAGADMGIGECSSRNIARLPSLKMISG